MSPNFLRRRVQRHAEGKRPREWPLVLFGVVICTRAVYVSIYAIHEFLLKLCTSGLPSCSPGLPENVPVKFPPPGVGFAWNDVVKHGYQGKVFSPLCFGYGPIPAIVIELE